MSALDDPAVESLARSFLLGTARNPAPVAAALAALGTTDGAPSELITELTALALLGQRMRFRRHGPPPTNVTAAVVEDRRAVVPEAARPLMRRLVGGRDGPASDIAALALADALDRHSLRPHPFDVPRLAGFVKAHDDLLGPYAAAWAGRGEEAEKQPAGYFDAATIDETNWTSARPAARAAFIAALRTRQPDRARALVETSFANEAAPVRARLLGALAPNLSAADVPFLEGLARDRAPSVRDEAQRLLKLVPGTAAAHDRLRDLVARTKVSTSGLVRRRKVLTLELPADVKAFPQDPVGDPARRWAAEEYAGVGLDAMAAAFSLSLPEMIAAAADDAALTGLFARQASLDHRFDVLATIVREHAADAWLDAIGPGAAVALHDDALIDQWCAAALAPETWPDLSYRALEQLYRFLRRPLPQPTARALLRSRAVASLHGWTADPRVLDVLCLPLTALVPAALRSELSAALAPLPGGDIPRTRLLLDCLTLIDPPHR
ncbi:MAG TPA: DUF5691 domain-containing protein [Xanthobacteraceae bacterium]|nr:DUF5691 domain-containing protein [Xanthobacteraceae bacterium]